jgi:hypothetical protein
MKKIIVFFIIATCLLSCNSTLDEVNPNQVTTSMFWKTENDVSSALAATYDCFLGQSSGYWGFTGIGFNNGRGDDFYFRNDMTDFYRMSTFTNTPDNGGVTNIWNTCYQAILRSNEILENVSNVPGLSDQSKASYIAEAKFLRGLNYFILVTNFGDVTLHLTVPKTTTDYFLPKSPEADVWKQVIQDFTNAAADLPISYPSQWVGRTTKGAALAYLGKAELYTKDWTNCVNTLTQLTKSPFTYRLMPNYQDNFLVSTENNQESIFELQCADVGGSSSGARGNATAALGTTSPQFFAPQEASGWYEAFPTEKMFKEFQKEKTTSGDFDPRMYTSIMWHYPAATFYNKPFSNFIIPFGFSSEIKKYQNFMQNGEMVGSSGATDITSDNNERALRYDDVLLMLAEALTMEGNVTQAYPYVQQIRDRANLTTLPTGYTKDQMMAEIRHQDMVEFFREGHRWYDLKRWGLIQQELTNSDKVGAQYYSSPKFDLFPIPQSEINSNPKMTQQSNW